MPSPVPILHSGDLYADVRNQMFAFQGPSRADRVGIEIELFPFVRDASGAPRVAAVRLTDSVEPSIAAVFARLAERLGAHVVDDGEALGLIDACGGHFTLEPAGQIEYSSPPFASVRAALDNCAAAVEALAAECREMGIELLERGYNNLVPESEHRLQVCKPRYLAMDAHFARIGGFGRRMMRSTCALQINLDFGSGAVAAERWRLANMIAPSLNAVFANAPHVYDGVRYRSFRYEIWRRADPTRTGRLFDSPDMDPIDDYLRFALEATVMMVPNAEGVLTPPVRPLTFGGWMSGSGHLGYPTWDDWRHHVSTLFPDVRARGWMELRSVDMMPRRWWGVPAAIATALLYNERPRRAALDRLEGRRRERSAVEYEHGGFWPSDYNTGAELLALALPYIDDAELAECAARYGHRYCRLGAVPADDDQRSAKTTAPQLQVSRS